MVFALSRKEFLPEMRQTLSICVYNGGFAVIYGQSKQVRPAYHIGHYSSSHLAALFALAIMKYPSVDIHSWKTSLE